MAGSAETRVVISVTGLGLALIVGFCGFALQRGWFAPRQAERELAGLPGMAAIRIADPDAHAALAAALVDVRAARQPPEVVLWHAGPALRRLLANHAPRAADDKVLDLGRVFLEILDSGDTQQGALCRHLLTPTTAPETIDTLLPSALARRAARASLSAIGSGIDLKRPLPPLPQLSPALERLSERLARVLPPADIARLPRLAAAPPETACPILRAVLRETLALPDHQAALLLRYGLTHAMGAGE